MTAIEPKAGFDWEQVAWGAPNEPQSDHCSYCGAMIPEEDVPLRLWSQLGWAAVFCLPCMRTWWGFETGDEEEPTDVQT